MNPEELRGAFAIGLDAGAMVRARRPGLFQIDLPTFLGDGDGVAIYVRPNPGGRLVVTDMGATHMRLSDNRELAPADLAELERLASAQGLRWEQGEIRTTVGAGGLLAAALGLVQVQSQAEATIAGVRRRARASGSFRGEALALVRSLFGDRVEAGYFDKRTDPEGLYRIDALVHGEREVAVALVANRVQAELAVSTKLALAKRLRSIRWLVVPRDLERLPSRTRQRLVREYYAIGSTFETDRDVVAERLRDQAGG